MQTNVYSTILSLFDPYYVFYTNVTRLSLLEDWPHQNQKQKTQYGSCLKYPDFSVYVN